MPVWTILRSEPGPGQGSGQSSRVTHEHWERELKFSPILRNGPRTSRFYAIAGKHSSDRGHSSLIADPVTTWYGQRSATGDLGCTNDSKHASRSRMTQEAWIMTFMIMIYDTEGTA